MVFLARAVRPICVRSGRPPGNDTTPDSLIGDDLPEKQ
jgi:hypothetical protein